MEHRVQGAGGGLPWDEGNYSQRRRGLAKEKHRAAASSLPFQLLSRSHTQRDAMGKQQQPAISDDLPRSLLLRRVHALIDAMNVVHPSPGLDLFTREYARDARAAMYALTRTNIIGHHRMPSAADH